MVPSGAGQLITGTFVGHLRHRHRITRQMTSECRGDRSRCEDPIVCRDDYQVKGDGQKNRTETTLANVMAVLRRIRIMAGSSSAMG